MSELENLSFSFPIGEMSGYLTDNLALIMPILILILAVLLAMLVIDGVTESLLKVIGFVAGVRTSGINDRPGQNIGLDDD